MSEFVEYLHEVFRHFGSLTTRKMFGGYGIYYQGLMFGLVADDELYLKTDEENLSAFKELGLEPFEYNKNGKLMKMSYYQAPEEIYDDCEVASDWANSAYAAALRSKHR